MSAPSAAAGLAALFATLAATTAAAQAPSEATSEPAASDGSPAPIKVAVVVVGDPEPALVTAAEGVSASLASDARLRMPSDPGIRGALIGHARPPHAEDDGLDGLRTERRRLGLGAETDTAALARIGQMTGAAVLALIRTRDGATELVVYDPGRRAYADGRLVLRASPATTATASADNATAEDETAEDATAEGATPGNDVPTDAAFVHARAVRAVQARAARSTNASRTGAGSAPPRRGESASRRSRPRTTDGDSDSERQGDSASTARGTEGTGDAPEEEEESSWFEDTWPLLIAGVLLIGVIVWFSLPDDPADHAPPVLMFIPGGN
jgi:hypothetical protein